MVESETLYNEYCILEVVYQLSCTSLIIFVCRQMIKVMKESLAQCAKVVATMMSWVQILDQLLAKMQGATLF
jgi:hypothetical protein